MSFLRKIKRGYRKITNTVDKYPVIILPYLTYGTNKMVYLRGRVLEDKNIRPQKDDNLFDLIRNTYKRFQTDEKVGVELTATIDESEFTTVTNNDGYFSIRNEIDKIELDEEKTNFLPVTYQLNNSGVFAHSQMLVPDKRVDFGIISDIDDTILHTGVSSFLKLKVLYNSLLKNATDREPLKGASQLYRALECGPSADKRNPFFYISNSPWNLYKYLRIFLKEQNFPKGPVLLRDFALPWQAHHETEKNHKQREIRNIFLTYPKMKFILFGDSSEHDARIYSDVAREFPEQVICIFLHTVSRRSKMEYVKSVISGSQHVEMILVNNAIQAAEHAYAKGLICENDFQLIQQQPMV